MARKKEPRQFSDLNFIISDLILKNLPFVAFLGFLATIYIANAHYAERNVRKIQVLQKDLKELRWHYMSLQSENMYNSKRSEIADKVKDDGLRLQRRKPKKIVVPKEGD